MQATAFTCLALILTSLAWDEEPSDWRTVIRVVDGDTIVVGGN